VFGAVESAIRREKQITPKQTVFLKQAQ